MTSRTARTAFPGINYVTTPVYEPHGCVICGRKQTIRRGAVLTADTFYANAPICAAHYQVSRNVPWEPGYCVVYSDVSTYSMLEAMWRVPIIRRDLGRSSDIYYDGCFDYHRGQYIHHTLKKCKCGAWSNMTVCYKCDDIAYLDGIAKQLYYNTEGIARSIHKMSVALLKKLWNVTRRNCPDHKYDSYRKLSEAITEELSNKGCKVCPQCRGFTLEPMQAVGFNGILCPDCYRAGVRQTVDNGPVWLRQVCEATIDGQNVFVWQLGTLINSLVYNEITGRYCDAASAPIIKSYHNAARTNSFKKQHPGKCCGVELEICVPSTINADSEARKVRDSGVTAHFEYDCSIGNGFELITNPMSLDQHKQYWSWLNTYNRTNLNSENSKCGLHIHISKEWEGKGYNKLSTLEIAKIVWLCNCEEWESLMFSLARRTECEYMNYEDTSIPNALKKHGHYDAVNIRDKTLEFRMFKGTLRYDCLIACVSFVFAISEYVRDMGFSQEPDLFLAWLMERKNMNRYKELRQYLRTKHVTFPKAEPKERKEICVKAAVPV